jgi:CHAT domain-containing protein
MRMNLIPRKNAFQIAGGVLLGCTVTLLLQPTSRAVPQEGSKIEERTLASSLGPVRPTEGRVDGQTLYAPYRRFYRQDTPSLAQLQHELTERTDSSSPSWLRDRAFLYLLSNRLSLTIKDLEEAVQKAPGEAALLSDLSAVYVERARAEDRPEYYVAALEMAERAVNLGSEHVEAVFNRAIALEHLFLYDEAHEAWRRYLELDTSSPWVDEARAHLERLVTDGDRRPGMDRGESLYESSSMAERLESLGKPAEAWRYRYRALAWTSPIPSRSQIPVALTTLKSAALACLAQRRPQAALDFQNRIVKVAESLGEPEQIVLARLDRARIEAALGRQEEARRDFGWVLKVLPDVRPTREMIAARIDVVSREIDQSEDRTAAIALEHQAPGLEDARVDFEFRRGDIAAAEGHLGQAMDAIERNRAQVAPGSDRVSFFDQAEPLYTRMVALQLHLAHPEKALEVLERFRSQALLDEIDGGRSSVAPAGWRELYRRVPAQTTLLVYAVVEGRLITWIVQPSGIRVSTHQPDWAMVSALVQRLPRAQGLTSPEVRKEIVQQLYGELVAPWSREVPAGDRIIFVPTRSLYSVPFAALRNPVSGRFLVQDHALGVAPSVSELLAAIERDHQLSAEPVASVLLVGDPAFNRNNAPVLPALPGAAWEVELLRRIYRGLDVRVLRHGEATPNHVLGALDGADVVHLAVHAQEDFEDPARSHLVLASAGTDLGELFARDISQQHLTRTRLVVLAACGSHAGPVSQSEGSLSLSHSFLAAGVPAVVGSLWYVTDDATQRLSVRFHQELLRGADAISALRTAQLAEISTHPGGSDWTWASFQVFGGVETRVP